MQAALLRVKLRRLDDWNEKRREVASQYGKLVSIADVGLPIVLPDTLPVWHLYVIRHHKRDVLQKYLQQKGIDTLIHYPIPVHQQSAYLKVFSPKAMELTQTIASSILSLPMYPGLKSDEIVAIADALNTFAG